MVLIAEGWSRLTKIIREERNRKNQFAEARRERGLEPGRGLGLALDWERGLEQGREQGLEQGLEQGREQGKEEMRAIIQERLELLGINPADVLPPSEPAPDDDAAQTADATDAELEDLIRHILQEQLARLGIRPDDPDDAPPRRGQ